MLLSRRQGSRTVGLSEAAGGLVSPQSVVITRPKALPGSRGEKTDFTAFFFFFFFKAHEWNLLREIFLSFLEVVEIFEILMKAMDPIPKK